MEKWPPAPLYWPLCPHSSGISFKMFIASMHLGKSAPLPLLSKNSFELFSTVRYRYLYYFNTVRYSRIFWQNDRSLVHRYLILIKIWLIFIQYRTGNKKNFSAVLIVVFFYRFGLAYVKLINTKSFFSYNLWTENGKHGCTDQGLD
jgi:hypothetical protein